MSLGMTNAGSTPHTSCMGMQAVGDCDCFHKATCRDGQARSALSMGRKTIQSRSDLFLLDMGRELFKSGPDSQRTPPNLARNRSATGC